MPHRVPIILNKKGFYGCDDHLGPAGKMSLQRAVIFVCGQGGILKIFSSDMVPQGRLAYSSEAVDTENRSPVLKNLDFAHTHISFYPVLLVLQYRDPRQFLPFEVLERRAAAGGDVGDPIGDARLFDCGCAVPSADDGHGL
jgi:hypothetical protein